jgi:hypothetical protein
MAPETTDELFIETPGGGQLNFANPLHVFDPSKLSEPKELPEPDNVTESVSWFQKHPNLDTSKPVPVRVGSASGKQIDVTYASKSENYPQDICGEQPCVPLYSHTTDGSINSTEGWKDWFVILDVGVEMVIIDVAAPTYEFDAFYPKVHRILDTVQWKGG